MLRNDIKRKEGTEVIMNKLCFYQKPICDVNSYYDMIDLAAKFGHDSIEGYSMFEFKTPDFEKAK